ncbi:MAG: HisS family protein, partial [Nanoarchaeota archaeon]
NFFEVMVNFLKQNPNIKLPFRRYQIGQVFRDEPTGAERFRQFTQCDADIIGDSSVQADAECLALFSSILKELKIAAEIQVNNRKLLNAIIESVEIKNQKEVMKELDKKEKIGEDMVKLNLKKYADSNQIMTLFKLFEKDLKFFIDNAFDGAKELQELQLRCRKYGLNIKFNPYMIRGLSYYTGNIFEIIQPGKGSLAGGGRYDKSVGKYSGKEIPAVGISFGFERVVQLANIEIETTKTIIISLKQDNETIKLTKKLRESGISCLPSFEKVGKALEFANALQIKYAIFIGEDEIKKGKYKLRDMCLGTEKFLTEKQILAELAENK